ncbi:MAG: hypothetical protein GY832_45430, partial [Chloroflexi bacterium]|nr:hypothetical protein [Chloroflexota bacterium]
MEKIKADSLAKEKKIGEHQNVIRALRQEQRTSNDKWTDFVQKKDKAKADETARCIAALKQQNDALQKRIHVSESIAPPSSLIRSQPVARTHALSPLVATTTSQSLPLVSGSVAAQSLLRSSVPHCVRKPGLSRAVAPHPQITSSALPQVQATDLMLQRNVARHTLEMKKAEVARVESLVVASVTNPDELKRLADILSVLGPEYDQLQAEFQQQYGQQGVTTAGARQQTTPLASSGGPATSQQSGATGAMLDPSAAVFQPVNVGLSDGANRTDLTGAAAVAGDGQITLQEYEATLDPSYIA